jgi:hypothetical protein
LADLRVPDAFTYHGHGTIIPFRFQDNQPEIKGSIDGIAGLFTIDTGDGGSLLLIAPFAHGLVGRYHTDLPHGGVAIGATPGVWARKLPAPSASTARMAARSRKFMTPSPRSRCSIPASMPTARCPPISASASSSSST